MHATATTGLLLLLGAANLATEPPAPSCFQLNDIAGWKATGDTRGLYLRLRGNRLFHLALASPCPLLNAPDSYLVSIAHGTDRVCRPIDWDLKVAQRQGGRMGCIVHDMTELTPAEAAALPNKLKP